MVMFQMAFDLGSSFEQGALNKIIMRDRAAARACLHQHQAPLESFQERTILSSIEAAPSEDIRPALGNFVTAVMTRHSMTDMRKRRSRVRAQ
jgi:hypothetical protein